MIKPVTVVDSIIFCAKDHSHVEVKAIIVFSNWLTVGDLVDIFALSSLNCVLTSLSIAAVSVEPEEATKHIICR